VVFPVTGFLPAGTGPLHIKPPLHPEAYPDQATGGYVATGATVVPGSCVFLFITQCA